MKNGVVDSEHHSVRPSHRKVAVYLQVRGSTSSVLVHESCDAGPVNSPQQIARGPVISETRKRHNTAGCWTDTRAQVDPSDVESQRVSRNLSCRSALAQAFHHSTQNPHAAQTRIRRTYLVGMYCEHRYWHKVLRSSIL